MYQVHTYILKLDISNVGKAVFTNDWLNKTNNETLLKKEWDLAYYSMTIVFAWIFFQKAQVYFLKNVSSHWWKCNKNWEHCIGVQI